MANEAKLATFSSKKMLTENGKKGTIIKFSERKEVEVIKATKYYNVGDILSPHVVKADALISQGIAKEFKPKTTKD
jgi:hypothetical protein